MRSLNARPADYRVLLFTPTGRDSSLLAHFLTASGISSEVCASVAELAGKAAQGCGAVLLAEEAVTSDSVRQLAEALEAQPAWSDLPFIVLTSGGEPSPLTDYKLKMLTPLGNVSLVERPVRLPRSSVLCKARSVLATGNISSGNRLRLWSALTRICSVLRTSLLTICKSLFA